MLRDPYIAGVERFELPLSASAYAPKLPQYKQQAALFCLLLWKQFQGDLRALRYHISFEHLDDTTLVFSQLPRYEDLINFDSNGASQIDIECISQQPASIAKHHPLHLADQDEYFPAFLEVFIPFQPAQPQDGVSDTPDPISSLIIWCKPPALTQVSALWEEASTLLAHRR